MTEDLRRETHRTPSAEIEEQIDALLAVGAGGCGVLSAKLARIAGSAPIPASSGRTDRHRLDRGGNRQLNCALHRLAVTKGRLDPQTAAYLARKQADGKTRREALRCLKRHLARRVRRLLQTPAIGGRVSPRGARGVTIGRPSVRLDHQFERDVGSGGLGSNALSRVR